MGFAGTRFVQALGCSTGLIVLYTVALPARIEHSAYVIV